MFHDDLQVTRLTDLLEVRQTGTTSYNYFDIPAEEWAQMSPEEQWAANQGFLDAAIARGDTFVFSNDFAPAGSFYEQELQYLQEQRIFEPVPGTVPANYTAKSEP